MTFQQLSYVVEISKCGSINKTASKLFLSQSGISAAIKELEEELGIQIFKRGSRGVELTAEGRDFLSYAVSLLEQKDRITSLYSEQASGTAAPLQHFSVSSQRYPFTEAAFLKMVQQAPKVRYRYYAKETALDAVIDDVYDHRADIGVIFLTEMTEKMVMHLLNSRDIVFHVIAEVPPSIYLREGHPLLAEDTLTEEMLADYPYLSFEQNQSVSPDLAEEYPMLVQRKPNQGIIVNNRTTALNIIRYTDAYTTGSGLFVEGLSTPGVLSIPLPGRATIKIGWISIKSLRPSQHAELFVELLQESIEESIAYTQRLRKAAGCPAGL